jgi:serine protease Do
MGIALMQLYLKRFLNGLCGLTIIIFPFHKSMAVVTSYADIAEKAIPGVVNIRTTSYIAGKDAWLDPYQFFLRGGIPRPQSTSSLGSGVIIDQKGHILTNHHVVEGASVIEILFAKSKRKVRAKVLGSDTKTDLALLSISPQADMHPLDLGDSDSLRIGDVVLAIGNPFGYAHTVTSGIISAKGRVIGTGPYDNFLQTDAAIHPGNSGGPLIDMRGRVIGINTAVSAEGQGIGFAIPSNIARGIAKNLMAYGKVIRPWMGIVGKDIMSRDEVESKEDVGIYGVIVTNLIVDGPAQKAGLRIGDLILSFEKERVIDKNHLQRLLSTRKPSENVNLRLYRRGKGFINTPMTLLDVPKAQDLPQEKDLF